MPDQIPIPLEDSSRNRIPDQIPSEDHIDHSQTHTREATAPPSNNKSSTLAPRAADKGKHVPLVPFLGHGYLTTWLSGLNGGSMKFVDLSIPHEHSDLFLFIG